MDITKEDLYKEYRKNSSLFDTQNINDVLSFICELFDLKDVNDMDKLNNAASFRYDQMRFNHFFTPSSWPKTILNETDILSAISFISISVNNIANKTKPLNIDENEIKKRADNLFKELLDDISKISREQ